MRVSVAGDIAELRHEVRLGGLGEVEDEALRRRESVREELPVGSQLVLGMVRPMPCSGHRERGDEASVAVGVLGHVEHGEEVRLSRVGGGRP